MGRKKKVSRKFFNFIFKLFYFIGAQTFNSLVNRKSQYKRSKSVELENNLGELDKWLHAHNLQESGASEELEPIKQATSLLLSEFSCESDVLHMCATSLKLTKCQIRHLLCMHANKCGKSLSAQFVASCMKEFRPCEYDWEKQVVAMDAQKILPMYIASNALNVTFLKKLSSL